MPSKRIIYECKYCGKEYIDYDECTEHEKSHIRDYCDANTQEIVDVLRQLSERAYGYHIGNTIMGIPVANFESLMDEAAKRLETLSKHKLEE